jgi:hypothetical protein
MAAEWSASRRRTSTQSYRPWFHPQSGLTLVRVPVDAAKIYCATSGWFVAPDALQHDDL